MTALTGTHFLGPSSYQRSRTANNKAGVAGAIELKCVVSFGYKAIVEPDRRLRQPAGFVHALLQVV